MRKVFDSNRSTYFDPAKAMVDKSVLAGVKVMFINMPLREDAPPNCLPLGPALLAARLRANGSDPSILDLNAYRIKDDISSARRLPGGRHMTSVEAKDAILKHINRFGEPRVVALSGMITTLRWQMTVANIIRSILPDVFIITGNGLATELGDVLFDWIPELDAIAQAEGDFSILKAVHDVVMIERGWYAIEPYYHGDINGRQKYFYDGGRPQDLDELPFPAYELLESDANGFNVVESYLKNDIWGMATNNRSAGNVKMTRSINTVSSRGCPFNCAFCYRGATGERKYSIRSPENLLREFQEYHRRYRVDFIGLLDDNFMVSRERIMRMVPLFKLFVQATGIRWGTHGRLDEAADLKPDGNGGHFNSPLRVDAMAEAGCVYIGYGAESADKTTLQKMGKGGFILSNGFVNIGGHEFPRTMVEGIRNTKAAGIQANCTWIMGYPGETLDQLKTSVAFIKWQEELYKAHGDAPSSVNRKFFVATAYPGTEMFKHPIVRKRLGDNFGVCYDPDGNPICDENLKKYVLGLDDATKIMLDKNGDPLNFSAMPDEVFLRAKKFSDDNQIEKIMEI